jgi:hypothetical protein
MRNRIESFSLAAACRCGVFQLRHRELQRHWLTR